MSSSDLYAILPLIILAAGVVAVMLGIALRRSHALAAWLAAAALALALAADLITTPLGALQVTVLLRMDAFARFFIGLITAAALVVVGLSYAYLRQREDAPEEYYLLLLSAALGAGVLAASSHLVSFFLGLEVLSVSLYVLIAYRRGAAQNIEAAVKYLVLASASSALLLFGMALTYAALGTMEFTGIWSAIARPDAGSAALALSGLALVMVGIGFKLAVVPFHAWTPDVYEGAPAPVTAFVATVSKGGMLALLLRLFGGVDFQHYPGLDAAFAIIAIASMIIGNLLALLQGNLKRILAYSSIAHLGYLLVAFLAGGRLGLSAAAFYLAAYFVTTLAAFGVITALSGPERDADRLDDYQGLFWRRPALAALLTAALLSLAGIPLTAGFVGKFYLAAAAVGSSRWLLVIVLILSSVIGLFYYLRVIVALYAPARPAEARPALALSAGGALALIVLALLLIWLGVYPAPLLQAAQSLVR